MMCKRAARFGGWLLLGVIAACKVQGSGVGAPPQVGLAGESYERVVENDFAAADAQPLSTFGLDVDTASYANVRDLLRRGQLPPPDAVRVEEFVNAFRSHTPTVAAADAALAVATELQACPWQAEHWLLRIAVRAREPAAELESAARLVFLIDVSGSMGEPDKLPLVQRALGVLLDSLRPQDQVAIVTYGSDVNVLERDASGADRERLRDIVGGLRAGGSTDGAGGLRAACRVAAGMRGEGPRRVVLVTDGDFNVGDSTPAALQRLLTREKRSDTFLTVLGCGRGNLKATNLGAVAKAGDGSYHYLDGMPAARRLFGARFHEALLCVARDAKVQVEFNPARVASWRLLGYEDRGLGARDFADAAKDGGEIGAGQTVVALYELVPKAGTVHDGVALRYGNDAPPPGKHTDEVASVRLAWLPVTGALELQQRQLLVPASALRAAPSPDLAVSATAAGFALLLRGSRFRGTLDWASLARMTDRLDDDDVAQHELTELVAQAERLSRGTAP